MLEDSKTYAVADLAALEARLAGLGIDFTKTVGSATVRGCLLQWTIGHDAVTVTVLHKPFYASYAAVFADIDKLFAPQGDLPAGSA